MIESKLKIQEKHNKIVEIVKSNNNLKEEFFDKNESSLEKQCLIILLSSYKIPLINKLIDSGYDNPDKIKALTDKELKTIGGFGPVKVEQFKIAITKIKKI
jgi:hypothetical protein